MFMCKDDITHGSGLELDFNNWETLMLIPCLYLVLVRYPPQVYINLALSLYSRIIPKYSNKSNFSALEDKLNTKHKWTLTKWLPTAARKNISVLPPAKVLCTLDLF